TSRRTSPQIQEQIAPSGDAHFNISTAAERMCLASENWLKQRRARSVWRASGLPALWHARKAGASSRTPNAGAPAHAFAGSWCRCGAKLAWEATQEAGNAGPTSGYLPAGLKPAGC